jgi:hypothetical protein
MAVSTTSLSVLNSLAAAQTLATNTDPAGVQAYLVSLDRAGSAVYRASASFTPQPTAAVTMITVTGSATKTVRIKRIIITGVSTATATIPVQLIRSTALGAGGTAVPPTVAKVDSGTVAAATAVVNHYTTTLKAAGTSTGIGPLTSGRLFTSKVTTPDVAIATLAFVYPEMGGPLNQSIVLRGATDFLEFQNTNAGNLSAGTVLDYAIEWEETSD